MERAFTHDQNWVWWVVPANVLSTLAPMLLVMASALWEKDAADIDWSGFLLVAALLQGIGLLASALAIGINLRRQRVVYRVSSERIIAEVDGHIVCSVSPPAVTSWSIDSRLIPIIDHFMFMSAPTASRKNGIQLRLWVNEDGVVAERQFPPLVIYSKEKYGELSTALETAIGRRSRDDDGP